jgi:hypothetical protein
MFPWTNYNIDILEKIAHDRVTFDLVLQAELRMTPTTLQPKATLGRVQLLANVF